MEIKEVTPEMRQKLRAALPKEAVKQHPTKRDLSTIKPIYVFERLNDVFGIGKWSVKTDLVDPISSEKKVAQSGRERTEFTALMKTTLSIPEYGIYHECIAGSTNEDEGDSAKGGTTDGLTKICSYLEIGINVFKGLGNTDAPLTETAPAKKTQPQTTKRSETPEDTRNKIAAAEAPVEAQEAANVDLATSKQKEEIIRLCNNLSITRQEKTKTLLQLNVLDVERAKACIAWLNKTIEEREAQSKAA